MGSKEKECQPTGDSAKSESAEKDSQEDSSPKEKEEKKDVEKEEEQQQGVKRRVEEEAGGTSRKVVRQSVSVSRLADLELLASLSSSQPGLLKREKQEQEGEPDSKKSNTVEEESKGLEKEAASRKADVVKAKKEAKLAKENKVEQTVETPVVASTKLRDAALEASFSSSRSKHKVEEPVVEEKISHNEQSFQEATTQSGPTSRAHLPVPILPLSTPLPAQSDIPTGSSSKKKETAPSPTFKETKQIIGAKELQNEKALQRKRLNKMLTIFEDQKVVNDQNGNQKFEDSLKLLENQNKLKEPPSFATALPRLPSHDEAM